MEVMPMEKYKRGIYAIKSPYCSVLVYGALLVTLTHGILVDTYLDYFVLWTSLDYLYLDYLDYS